MNDLDALGPVLDSESESDADARRRRSLVLLAAMVGLSHFNRISISAAGAEHLMSEYAIGEARMGMVYSAYLFVYTIFMMPGGWLIDRVGPRRALLALGIGSSLLVPATGLASLAPAAGVVAALCLVRGLLGMASAPLHPASARAVSLWFPSQSRSTANGIVTAAALLGIAATYPVFGRLMDVIGWPRAFFAMGAVTLATTAAWWTWTDDRRPFDDQPGPESSLDVVESSQTRAGLVALLRNRSLILLTISYATLSYFQYLFFYWMQYYFDVVLKLGKSDARLYTMIPTLAMAAGMAAGGWLADRAEASRPGRVGRIVVPALGMLVSAVFLALGAVGDGALWVVGFFTAAMGALGASESSFWVTSVELGRRRGGLSASILNTGGNLGGMLAPVVTPLFSGLFGWKAGLFLASALCVVGASLWLWVDPREGAEVEPAVEVLA